MPIYDFQSDDGQVIGVDYPMSRAPRLGRKIRRGGKVYRRVLSPQGAPRVSPDWPARATRAVAKRHPFFKNFDSAGRPIVESRRQAEAYARSQGLEWS